MAYDYRTNRRTTTTTNRPGRRSLYAPPPPPSSSHHHGLLTYWLPLVVTGTIAIGGLAAWIWSERNEHEHHDGGDYPQGKPPRPAQQGPYPPNQPQQGGPQGYPGPQQQQQQGPPRPPLQPSQSMPGGEASTYYDPSQPFRGAAQNGETEVRRDVREQETGVVEDGTWYGRVTGMMKRTPSPQSFFDSASRGVYSGVAAVGGALGSIMEDPEAVSEDRRDVRVDRRGGDEKRVDRRVRAEESQSQREGFSDHERWSEEAEAEERRRVGVVEAESERRAESARNVMKGRGGKAVAVVVSADAREDVEEEGDEGFVMEHASILSYLPTSQQTSTDLFILIYAPTLQSLPPLSYQPQQPSTSSITPATTPGSELQSISPRPSSPNTPGATPSFNALYTRALSLVSSPSQILPFTTKEGYVHILRHLKPSLLYLSDALAGEGGESVEAVKGWVGHTVLVAGDEGMGGLVDTETENETEAEGEDEGGRQRRGKGRGEKWWERSSFVGLGKEVEVVDAVRVGEDWGRRVGGRG